MILDDKNKGQDLIVPIWAWSIVPNIKTPPKGMFESRAYLNIIYSMDSSGDDNWPHSLIRRTPILKIA